MVQALRAALDEQEEELRLRGAASTKQEEEAEALRSSAEVSQKCAHMAHEQLAQAKQQRDELEITWTRERGDMHEWREWVREAPLGAPSPRVFPTLALPRCAKRRGWHSRMPHRTTATASRTAVIRTGPNLLSRAKPPHLECSCAP